MDKRENRLENHNGLITDQISAAQDRRSSAPAPKEEMIRIDGRGQVLQLLRYADAEYREFLLRAIERRDPALARALRRDL